MKMEEKLNEIENLLADLNINLSLLQEELLKKYANDVSDEQYLNDIVYIEELNKYINHTIYAVAYV
jgi:hypothetical protein